MVALYHRNRRHPDDIQMKPEEVDYILADIKYKDWQIEVDTHLDPWLLRVKFTASGQRWTGRWWRLSHHMTKSELVQTALKAVLTAEEHEAREHFLYKGVPVFGPHINVDALWTVATVLDVREG